MNLSQDLILRIESAVRHQFGMKLTALECEMILELLETRLPADVLALMRKRTVWERLMGRRR